MGQFEYLSVLVSIIVGLAIANLLSGTARLIQLRARVRPHATTFCWMATLFLINVQVWWVAFERRRTLEWTFFSFLLYLLIPITLFLVSTLVLPDLGDEDAADLRANFDHNRAWFFGLLAAVPVISLVEQSIRDVDGGLALDADVVFRLVFMLLLILAARIANPKYQFWNAVAALSLFVGYVATLFLQLR